MMKKITNDTILHQKDGRDGDDLVTKVYSASKKEAISNKNLIVEVIRKGHIKLTMEKIDSFFNNHIKKVTESTFLNVLQDNIETKNYLMLIKPSNYTRIEKIVEEKGFSPDVNFLKKIMKPMLKTIVNLKEPIFTLSPFCLYKIKREDFKLDFFSLTFSMNVMNNKIEDP
jgi:hypothetical protein